MILPFEIPNHHILVEEKEQPDNYLKIKANFMSYVV